MSYTPELRNAVSTTSYNSRAAAALGAGVTFQGVGEDVSAYGRAGISITSTNATDGVLTIEVSRDNVTWGGPSRTWADTRYAQPHMWNIVERYFRIKYVNGSTPAVDLAIQVQYSVNAGTVLGHQLDETLTDEVEATVTRSLGVGKGEDGQYYNTVVDSLGNMRVGIGEPLTVFDEVLMAQKSPQVQVAWGHGLLEEVTPTTTRNGATATEIQSELKCATGVASNARAYMRTSRLLSYRAGQGSEAQFTTRFVTHVTGTSLLAGMIDPEDGFAVGYHKDHALEFGLLHRYHGQREIRQVIITTSPTGAGNITITLDGVATLVAVLATDDINETARKIANTDFSGVGNGWRAFYAIDRVIFLADQADLRAGAYTFGAGGTGAAAVAGITQSAAAVVPTEDWEPQTTWTVDKADGSGALPVLVPLNGNVWKVVIGYLGYLGAVWYLKSPTTLRYVLCHRVSWSNANTKPVLGQATLPLSVEAFNVATLADVEVRCTSMEGSTQGTVNKKAQALPWSYEADKPSTGTTELVLVAFRVPVAAHGKTVKVSAILESLMLSNDNTKLGTFRLYHNPGLQGAGCTWSAVNSFLEACTDVSALISTDKGDLVGAWSVAKDSTLAVPDIAAAEITGYRGDLFCFTFTNSAAGTDQVGVTVRGFIDL